MSFGSFLWLLIRRPRLALEQGKGRFLLASLLLGGLAGGASAYLFRLFAGTPVPISLLRLTVINLISFAVISYAYHRVALHYADGNASWQEFASLFGFSVIPGLLADLLTVCVLHLVSMRSPYYPGLVSFGTGWFILTAAFSGAMGIAGYIYQGLIIQTVHRLPWKRVLATMAIILVSQEMLLNPMLKMNMRVINIPWETAALMTTGVSKVEISSMLACGVETRPPAFEIGELVLTNIQGLTINQRYYSDVATKSNRVLTEIMAGPGETVELCNGSLWINGKLVRAAAESLPQLTMDARELRPDQYFVYFRSPEGLGRSVTPEQLIISKTDISVAVPDSTLEYLEWQLR